MEHIARTSISRSPYRIRLVLFGNGERCPMIIDRETGLPLFQPTVWTLRQYRHRSAATIEQALRDAMLLHLFCRHRVIDLGQRLSTGDFLNPHEIDALVTFARKPLSETGALAPLTELAVRPARLKAPNVASLGTRHMRRLPGAEQSPSLDNRSVTIRLHYVTSYLKWLGNLAQERIRLTADAGRGDQDVSRSHGEGLRRLVEAILARQPGGGGGRRVALTPEQRTEVLRVTRPDSPDNPWQDPSVRVRNRLILLWLMCTGMRRGELLSVRIRDIRFGTGCVELKRTHDDKRDPRLRQPVAKGGERLAPLDEEVVELTQQYIAERGRTEAARRHGFLFAAANGAPLSLSSLTALFAALREAHPQLKPVSAHVLRHTWNEDFSAFADEVGMDRDDEDRTRRDLMGWSLHSKMPAVYGRRRAVAKANQFSMAMQRRMLGLADGVGAPDAQP
jgi:integrase